MHGMAKAFDKASFVGCIDTVRGGTRKGVLKQLGGERLRGLRQNDALAGNGGGDERDVLRKTRALYLFHRVHGRNTENYGVTLAGLGNHPVNLFAGDEGARGGVG